MKRIHLLLLMIFGCLTISAQSNLFKSQTLSNIAKNVGYNARTDLSEGYYDAGSAFGMSLVAEYNGQHQVVHLGFKLFNQELKTSYPSEIYNFLERYFLELYCWKNKTTTLEQKLIDDKFIFVKGNLQSVKQVNPNLDFSINKVEGKYYEVAWSKNRNPFLSVAFPIQYELLLGMPQNEIENGLSEEIANVSLKDSVTEELPSLKLLTDSIYCTDPIEQYEVRSLTNAIYYIKGGDDYHIVLDSTHVNFSITNLLQCHTNYNNIIQVTQKLYGFKEIRWNMTLQQWINYVKSNKLKTYAAVEENYEKGFKVLLIATCEDLGYNHMLSLTVPTDIISNPHSIIEATIHAYIPTHNVKNLYQQYKKTKKKQI